MSCDKVAILMSARKTGYGDEVDFDVSCGNCNHKHELKISLTSLLDNIKENVYYPRSGKDWEYSEESQTFSFEIATSNIQINIKLLSPDDMEDLQTSKEQKKKLNCHTMKQ